MSRIVTMVDFQALKDASQRLGQGVRQGYELAMNAQQIVMTAEMQGQADWAQRFADGTMKDLTEAKRRLADDFIRAATQFTGERLIPGETLESYLQRIDAAIADSTGATLDAMMKRNGVTLVDVEWGAAA